MPQIDRAALHHVLSGEIDRYDATSSCMLEADRAERRLGDVLPDTPAGVLVSFARGVHDPLIGAAVVLAKANRQATLVTDY